MQWDSMSGAPGGFKVQVQPASIKFKAKKGKSQSKKGLCFLELGKIYLLLFLLHIGLSMVLASDAGVRL